jgi:hypothetical protein
MNTRVGKNKNGQALRAPPPKLKTLPNAKLGKTKQDILDVAWTIPNGTKANCYVFGLGPKVGPGGFHNKRMYKARPGDKCPAWRAVPYDFVNCEQTVKRVLCDNPKHVRKVEHDKYLTKDIGPDQHLMAAILSPKAPNEDFHFLRRVTLSTVLKSWDHFKQRTPIKCQKQLVLEQPKYIWAHQQGWSNGIKIHDAAGNLIVDPSKADFNYKSLDYSIYCGLFAVKTREATVTTQFDY